MSEKYPNLKKANEKKKEIDLLMGFVESLDGDIRLRRERTLLHERESLLGSRKIVTEETDYPLPSGEAVKELIFKHVGIDLQELYKEREQFYQDFKRDVSEKEATLIKETLQP